jgi:hypothetical protein
MAALSGQRFGQGLQRNVQLPGILLVWKCSFFYRGRRAPGLFSAPNGGPRTVERIVQ